MSKTKLGASPELCRLKTAAALIPIIEGGIADSKISHEQAALMLAFCEWAADIEPGDPDQAGLLKSIEQGLARMRPLFRC